MMATIWRSKVTSGIDGHNLVTFLFFSVSINAKGNYPTAPTCIKGMVRTIDTNPRPQRMDQKRRKDVRLVFVVVQRLRIEQTMAPQVNLLLVCFLALTSFRFIFDTN